MSDLIWLSETQMNEPASTSRYSAARHASSVRARSAAKPVRRTALASLKLELAALESRFTLPTYVVLYNFTDEGAKNVKGTVGRVRDARSENERRGFKTLGVYWTQGPYDLVAVVEAPDEQAMLAGLFNIAGAGNVRSMTLRAFTENEIENVLKKT